MTLQEFIDKRLNLSYTQQTSLIELLGHGLVKKQKELFKSVIMNKFYSSFDGKSFSKDFLILTDEVRYRGSKLNLKEVRKIILEG